jgi:hypothetical protein
VRIDFTSCVIEYAHETVTGAKGPRTWCRSADHRAQRTSWTSAAANAPERATYHDPQRRQQFSASATGPGAGFAPRRFVFPDGATALHERDWSSTFTADGGLEITPRHLPAGTWIVNGTSAWTKGERSWSLAVTNLAPLHYDPVCEFRPRFDAGAVQIVATGAIRRPR